MKTSAAGRAAIKQREGCKLVAYYDTVRVPTIGIGHTGRAAPPPVRMGQRITAAQADAYLASDLVPTEAEITKAIKRPMTTNQADGFASLAFNIGGAGFGRSTVVKRFNAGDLAGAADAFLLWCKPAVLKGRRLAERKQFLGRAVVTLPSAGGAPQPPAVLPARPPPVPVSSVPPSPPTAAQPESKAVMRTSALVAFLLALFGASVAGAADVDFSPLVSAGLNYLVVPLLSSAAVWLVGVIGTASKRYLDQKTASLLASNVDGVLQKAISYGTTQAAALIEHKDFHANVDGWIASYAASYATSHAPQLMKQAGDVTQKIVARLAEHPDVLTLKHKSEANDNAPAAKAAA